MRKLLQLLSSVLLGIWLLTNAYAGSVTLLGAGKPGATATAYSVVYRGTLTWSAGSTITGSVDIGAADANKEVFLTSYNGGSGAARTLTAASTTVDGIAVTKCTTETNIISNFTGSCAFVSTPTSAGSVTITATYSGTLAQGVVGVYTVYSRPGTGTNEDDASTGSGASGTSSTTSGTTINNNGIWFGIHLHNNANVTTPPGGTVVEDDDISHVSNRWTVNHRDVEASGSTPSDTWSWSGSNAHGSMSWSFD